MSFLAGLFQQFRASLQGDGAAPKQRARPAPRSAVIEWQDSDGREITQKALLQSDADGKPRAFVRQPPPGSLVRIREAGASYPVEIQSKVPVDGGFELRLHYLGPGRRREARVPAEGPALLEVDGLAAIKVEVVNVSPGGMQLLSAQPAGAGAAVRVSGTGTEYLGVVRYCKQTPKGYRIGLQLFGENRR